MSRRTSPTTRRSRFGFTLVEMLVALSVTSVLLLLVSRIFNQTTKAISLGADTSTILSHARTVSDQVYADSQKMITAKGWSADREFEPGGFLVIVQQMNGGSTTNDDGWVLFPDPNRPNSDRDNWVADSDGDGNVRETNGDDYVHSGQLIFFRNADDMESITPGSVARYDADALAGFSRIWLGHAARYDTDEPNPNNFVGNEIGQEFNQHVTDLVMGRQALMLIDDLGSYPDGIWVQNGNAEPETIYAEPPAANLLTNGSRIDLAPVNNGDGPLWQGETDVLRIRDVQAQPTLVFGFDKFFEDSVTADDSPGFFHVNLNPAFNPTPPASTPPYDRSRGSMDPLSINDLPNDTYAQAAMGWGFLGVGQRLLTTHTVNYPFAAADVGRTHSMFVPYVSDIVIEFAADIADDYTYDRDKWPGGVPDPDASFDQVVPVLNGNTLINPTQIVVDQPPDGLPDGRPDEYVWIDPDTNEVKRAIKWYNAVDVNIANLNGDALNPSRPITWPIPVNAPNWITQGSNVNQASRVPYHTLNRSDPVVNARFSAAIVDFSNEGVTVGAAVRPYPPLAGFQPGGGGVITPFGEASLPTNVQRRAVFVFGHTADGSSFDGSEPDALPHYGSAKWWPYLIRIRYRLHDGNASYTSVNEITEDKTSGRWFEQIIPVPRKETPPLPTP